MTITENEMYWILKLDDIRNLMENLAIPLAVISMIGFIVTLIAVSFERKSLKLFIIPFMGIASAVFLAIAWALTPSTKQYAAIKVVPALVESKLVQKDFPEVYELGIDYVKEKLTTKKDNKP